MKEYIVYRKSDGHRIHSNDVSFAYAGAWVNDELESGRTDCKVFLPYGNIDIIVERQTDED